MQKIDFHSHCDSGDPEHIRHFVDVYEERDVVACLSGGLFYGGHDMLPNEEVIKLCAKFPGRILPIAKITLWNSPPPQTEVSADGKGLGSISGTEALKNPPEA